MKKCWGTSGWTKEAEAIRRREQREKKKQEKKKRQQRMLERGLQ